MKIVKSLSTTNLFDKTVDSSDDITEGSTKLFYPTTDQTKVGYLPAGANQYLEIEQVIENPGSGTEGDVIYNTIDSKFYHYVTDEWVEGLFLMGDV